MDETLCIREETAQLCAELLACPSNNDFASLQAQVPNLCLTIRQSKAGESPSLSSSVICSAI
jgi:hypothetical protein